LWFLPIFRPDITWSEEKFPHQVSTVPLTAIEINKTGPSDLTNRTIRFLQFSWQQQGGCQDWLLLFLFQALSVDVTLSGPLACFQGVVSLDAVRFRLSGVLCW
jgi:hypothetical protein